MALNIIYRLVKGGPLTYAEGDTNTSLLLTNLSGSLISISGSLVNIDCQTLTSINSPDFRINSNFIYLSSDLIQTGSISISGSENINGSITIQNDSTVYGASYLGYKGAVGIGSVANSNNQFVIGQYNDTGSSDPFVIGQGSGGPFPFNFNVFTINTNGELNFTHIATGSGTPTISTNYLSVYVDGVQYKLPLYT